MENKEKKELFFGTNDQEKDYSFNHPGMEHFKSTPFYSTARETVQNSIDAIEDTSKPVMVEIEVRTIDPSDLPGFDELKNAVKHIKNGTQKTKKNNEIKTNEESVTNIEGLETFISNADNLLNKNSIKVLSISDTNTKGMLFDEDATDNPFMTMLKSDGKSMKPKSGLGLGSFGIGKFAPFNASNLRTIFYRTTFKRDGILENYIQSRTILPSFKDDKEKPFTGEGWYGLSGASIGKPECNVQPIRGIENIPDWLKPKMEESGTTLHIIGFKDDEGWEKKMKISLLTNYFVAIEDGKLAFNFNGEIIDNSDECNYYRILKDAKLKEIAEKEYDEKEISMEFNDAKAFARAYRNPTHIVELNIPFFRKSGSSGPNFELRIHPCIETDEHKIEDVEKAWKENGIDKRKVGFFRNGMFISSIDKDIFGAMLRLPPKALPFFYATLHCKDPEGNSILKDLEDPSHKKIEVSRYKIQEDKIKIKEALDQLRADVKEEILEKLTKSYSDSDERKLDFVSQLLIADGSRDDDSGKEPDPYTLDKEDQVKKTRKKKIKKIEVGEGKLGGKNEERGKVRGRKKRTTSGTGEGDGTGGKGNKKYKINKENVRVIYKAKDQNTQINLKNINSSESVDIMIDVEAADTEIPVSINSAKDSSGVDLKTNKNVINDINVDVNGNATINIEMDKIFQKKLLNVWVL